MKSKRGIVITGIVLAAITAASFTVWMVPQNTPTRFIVSNASEDLDALIEQQGVVASSTSEEFDRLLAGETTADNYIAIAETTHSQVNSFIIKIVDTQVPSEWADSYGAFADSLRAYNSYLAETVVVAKKLKDNIQADVSSETAKMEQYLKQADEFLAASNSARP